jgi:outer membrane immunogenic protein
MRHILLASVSAIALTCGAQAADLPVKAPPPPPVIWSWAGPYLGIQGGVVSHRGEFDDPDGFLTGAFTAVPPATFRATKTGAIFGGHVGYNLQSGSIVYGLEGDFSGLWAKGHTARADEPTSFANFNVNWLATIRARLGVAVANATLLYVTGGVAFGDVRNHAGVTALGTNMVVDKVKTGWTVGGGIEHMFARNWTARAEVRYADLGNTAVTCTPAGSPNCVFPYRGEFSNKLLMGLVGVSLKF